MGCISVGVKLEWGNKMYTITLDFEARVVFR